MSPKKSRKPYVIGNWKMHGSKAGVDALLQALISNLNPIQEVQVVVCPPAVYLEQAGRIIAGSSPVASISMGAQNLYPEPEGAFTGEISGPMLFDIGCRYVIIGHSERRALFGETDGFIARKVDAALKAGLRPILCLGETRAEREKAKTFEVVFNQLEAAIKEVSVESFKQGIIAYEPIWAIGTGLTASPHEAQAVHQFIRAKLSERDPGLANIPILYGGSVKASNAKALFSEPDIDGGLIGGASLNHEEFINICLSALN